MASKFIKRAVRHSFVKPMVESVKQVVVNYKTVQLTRHFSQYFLPVAVQSHSELVVSQQLRHKVYCDEMNFLPLSSDKIEQDEMDHHSYHCFIKHISSDVCAGTVRIVHSKETANLLPIEVHCKELLEQCVIKPNDFPRDQLGEISRLAVDSQFRRRQHEKEARIDLDECVEADLITEKELRTFPLISLAVYLAAGNICQFKNIEHIFVMMEPRLAKRLSSVGFTFQKIGPEIDYHGMRAPYYCRISELADNMPKNFRALYKHLGMALSSKFDD
ncbi:PEP-CTERM/exosortase system-associated acyltransferase [Marinomonas algicola]|uniref:PEP-CTERM/exosortase system-associated acyltransferase n=1 Tax=Marinomonas algicola TaxID=2773454 RepID=UPI00174930FE|nr:PEP-CTERM/exosortase system-associated acyltransferase [Marinomonas algicola]